MAWAPVLQATLPKRICNAQPLLILTRKTDCRQRRLQQPVTPQLRRRYILPSQAPYILWRVAMARANFLILWRSTMRQCNNINSKNKDIYDLNKLVEDIKKENIEKKVDIKNLLLNYKNLRTNQLLGLTNVFNQKFQTGIHNQIMGAGKTILELLHVDLHYKYFQKNVDKTDSIYLFVSSRLNILKDIFFDKNKKEQFFKYGFNMNDYNIIDLVNCDINLKKNLFSIDKPNIIVCNIQYLQSLMNKKEYFNNVISRLKFVIFDECHNISAPNTHKFMMIIKKNNIPIIGFSATPTRTHIKAKSNFKDIFFIDDKPNIISTYDLFQAITDNCILPFVIKQFELKGKIIDNSSNSNDFDNISYDNIDFNYNENIIKKAIDDELKITPFSKIVGWCSSIKNAEKWKDFFSKKMTNLDVYMTHSGNIDNPAINEYEIFKNLKPMVVNGKITKKVNALLLCVGRVSEGCDIDFVDIGVFLDPVKNKNIVNYLQCAGRISRTDNLGFKKQAVIIFPYNGNIDVVKRLIEYYKTLLQLSDKDETFYNKITELFDQTKLIDTRQIRISVDNNEKHDCVLYFDKTIENWNIVKDSLKKIIDMKYSIKKNNDLLLKIEEYNFKFSKLSECRINDVIIHKPSFVDTLRKIYIAVGDIIKINKYNVNVHIGRVENEYIEEINVSFHRADAKRTLLEIINQSINNFINLSLSIRLKENKFISVLLEKDISKMIIYDIVDIDGVEYLKNEENIYKFENNIKGKLYAKINLKTGKAKILNLIN